MEGEREREITRERRPPQPVICQMFFDWCQQKGQVAPDLIFGGAGDTLTVIAPASAFGSECGL